MARDIESIERTTLTPTSNLSSGNAFDRLADATNSLSQMINSKLNEAQIQMEAEQGAKDAAAGTAPKTLAPGLNKVTRAYNQAVSDTEARSLIAGAKTQISEAYAKATSPANFTPETPAMFKAEVQGIIDGTLDHARDSNRGQIATALNEVSSAASVNMLNHSLDYDNKQTIKNMTNEIDQLVKDRRNAAIEGNKGNLAAIDEKINQSLTDYAIQNASIRSSLPELQKTLNQNMKVDQVLGDYAQAASEGKQAEFLNKLAMNEDKLDFDTWEQSTKAVLALDATEQKLKIQGEAIQKQTVFNGIDNGTITNTEQISNYGLKPLDQLQMVHRLEAHQRALAKAQYKTIEAQKNIAQGRPGMNTAEVKNQMFTNARNTFEQLTGHPMSLDDMWQSINGYGPTPASGIPGVSMGANVPQFDDQLKNQLTSNDPAQVAAAAMIYNNGVNVMKKPNMINLTGDALAIATHFNTLNLGNIDPLTLAQRVSDVTLKATDADYKIRSQNFNQLYVNGEKGVQNIRNKYAAVFDTAYKPGVDDAAMGVFQETFRQQYMRSTNEDAALAATKQELRAWGTSKWFEDGMVAQPVPEKEFGIANIGYAFDNQLRIRTQRLVDQNKKDLAENAAQPKNKQNPNPFTITWARPEQNIDIASLTEEDKVFKPIGQSSKFTDYFRVQAKPEVKINGQDTDIFLMPLPESRLGDRIQYGLFYHDKFGNPQPVPDANNPTGYAMFSPDDLKTYAPTVEANQNDQRIKDAALRFQKEQALQDMEAFTPKGAMDAFIQQSTFGLYDPDSDEVKQRKAEAYKTLQRSEAPEIESFFRQSLRGNENAATQPAESKKADYVGINAIAGGSSSGGGGGSSDVSANAAAEKKTDESAAPSVVESVSSKIPKVEGIGSKIKGDVATGRFGLTDAALKDMGVKKRVKELSKSEATELSEKYLTMKFNELSKNVPNYKSASDVVQEALLDATYNAGASRVIEKVNRFAKDNDWVGAMFSLLDVSTKDGKTLAGLGLRRAEEYNNVAQEMDAPKIKYVEQKKKSLVFIGDNGEVMLTINKPRHPDSKIRRHTVANAGSK